MDGLTIDGNGNIYVSCWGDNAIYRYDNTFSLPAELISSGHNGPADIFYNQLNNILAIPNFYSNEVDFIPITPIGVNEGTYIRLPRLCFGRIIPIPLIHQQELIIQYHTTLLSKLNCLIFWEMK